MIQRYANKYLLVCDNCGEAEDQEFFDFYDAVIFKCDKVNRWRSYKNKDGQWEDVCPVCLEAE